MSRGLVHESSKNLTCEWYTPAWIFEALGLTFDIDPCHPEGGQLPWVPAAKVYTKADDGLIQPWTGRVWLNPPYGKETERWLWRMSRHRHGIALLFARTDNTWFHDHIAQADAICFMQSRVRFVNRDGERGGTPGAGSMLVAWGQDCVEALYRANLGFVCVAGRRE